MPKTRTSTYFTDYPNANVPCAESRVIQSHWEHVKFKTVAPARVDARRSGEVVLECAATGSPAPAVEWYKVATPRSRYWASTKWF